jgi:hypothetical protein
MLKYNTHEDSLLAPHSFHLVQTEYNLNYSRDFAHATVYSIMCELFLRIFWSFKLNILNYCFEMEGVHALVSNMYVPFSTWTFVLHVKAMMQ